MRRPYGRRGRITLVDLHDSVEGLGGLISAGGHRQDPSGVSRIFISYRREDSAGHAGRVRAWLQNRLGGERIFFDLHGIEPGEDFVAAI
jgi:hypothetical protein